MRRTSIRGPNGNQGEGWWSGVGFVSVGFRRISRIGDGVRTTIRDMSGPQKMDLQAERWSRVGFLNGSVGRFRRRYGDGFGYSAIGVFQQSG